MTTAYFEKHAACLTSYLVLRSYKDKHIRKIMDEVKTIPRKNLIKSTPKSVSKKTPFITTFHSRLSKFNSFFNKLNNLLSEDFCLKAIFSKKPITTYGRCPTLRDVLVKSKLKSTCTTFLAHGFFRCDRHNCSTCKYYSENSSFRSNHISKTFNIHGHITCNSSNLIYSSNLAAPNFKSNT